MVVLLLIVVAGVMAAGWESSPTIETAGHEHCFAEWCIAPQASSDQQRAVTVQVAVRSDAKQASQRPDHPQAWLIDAAGRQVGGPQPALDGLMGPGDVYTAALTFTAADPGNCPRLVISEGGWPPFLGLGYAPSPFTAEAEWRLCELPGIPLVGE